MEFGEFLREKRLTKGMSIRQVALYGGVSDSYLSQLERGVAGGRGPTPHFLRKLVRPLGVPYEVLMAAAGYHILTEDEKLYTGVLVTMLREAHGDSVEEFALRVGLHSYEVDTLEQHGVKNETLESIYQGLFLRQKKLTSEQKAFIHRLEETLQRLPTDKAKKLESVLFAVLDLV